MIKCVKLECVECLFQRIVSNLYNNMYHFHNIVCQSILMMSAENSKEPSFVPFIMFAVDFYRIREHLNSVRNNR